MLRQKKRRVSSQLSHFTFASIHSSNSSCFGKILIKKYSAEHVQVVHQGTWVRSRAEKSKSLLRCKSLKFRIRLSVKKYLISGDVLNLESEGLAQSQYSVSPQKIF